MFSRRKSKWPVTTIKKNKPLPVGTKPEKPDSSTDTREGRNSRIEAD